MVRKIKYIVLITALLLSLCDVVKAQKVDAFARVSVSPRQGVVRQPYKVNISVYSGTWFTQGLQFSNLRINDAFIIPFTRTVSSLSYINKKKYATLTFYYLVFPYNSGDLVIPEITMTTSIPPEGGWEGIPTTLKTKPQTIKVRNLPKSEDEVWLVAKSAYIDEKWNKSTKTLKVGDVIKRTISIRANGTLPSLIAPLDIKEPEDVSVYTVSPILQDKRDEDDVNGVRIETYSYLFEKQGNITIPAEEIVWWNPYTKKTYKRTLAERTLTILPNPDLALLNSIRDSLDALNAPSEAEIGEGPFPWKRTITLGLLTLISLWIVYRTTSKELQRVLAKRKAYLQSEQYHFKRVTKAAKSGHSQLYVRELYTWFDHTRKENATITSLLTSESRAIFGMVIQSSLGMTERKLTKNTLLSLAKMIRKEALRPQLKITKETLNP